MTLEHALFAGGLSLLVAVAATALATALAIGCGALDAFDRLSSCPPRGWAVYAPPAMVLLVPGVLDNLWLVSVGGTVAWLNLAWVVHRQVALLHRRAFVDAARLAGVAPGGIVRRHVLPHLGRPLALRALLTVPQVLLADVLRQLLEAAAR